MPKGPAKNNEVSTYPKVNCFINIASDGYSNDLQVKMTKIAIVLAKERIKSVYGYTSDELVFLSTHSNEHDPDDIETLGKSLEDLSKCQIFINIPDDAPSMRCIHRGCAMRQTVWGLYRGNENVINIPITKIMERINHDN